MKRKILIAVLGLGAVGGFAAGFAGLHHRGHYRHRHFEERVADICTRSAERVFSAKGEHKPGNPEH